MSPRRLLFAFLFALTAVRLFYIGQIELSPDEAYYFQWSERLDFGYYSKGPGVAAAIWLSTHLFGQTEFGVRALSPLLALGTSLLMFSFTRRIFSEPVALWTVLMMNLTPIFQVGGLIMTIDPLSIFFWIAALYTFWLALEKSPAFSLWWPATGALIGLGFLCKYTNAMQLLSVLLLLAFTPKYRRELLRAGFYSLLGTFAVFMLPPIIWNARHDWITVSHLSARGGLNSAFKVDPAEFLNFIGAHFGVYSPLIFAGMLVALWFACGTARQHYKPRFLLAFTLPLFVLYLILSLKQAGEANWTAPATLSLAPLAAAFWYEAAAERRWARISAVAALALGLLASLVTIDTELLRRVDISLPYKVDPSARLRGWRTAAETVDAFRKQYERDNGQPVFLIANKYGSAASLSFYLPEKRVEAPGHPPIYVPESPVPENQYYFWPRYDGLTDYADVARDLLRSPTALTPEVRTELQSRLAELPPSRLGETPERDNERRRRFLQALQLAAPELGIDAYYTEAMGYSPFIGRTALYITDRAEERPPSMIKRGFEHVEMIACIDFQRRNLPLRQLRIFACRNFRQSSL